jgi:hypothetical protein
MTFIYPEEVGVGVAYRAAVKWWQKANKTLSKVMHCLN